MVVLGNLLALVVTILLLGATVRFRGGCSPGSGAAERRRQAVRMRRLWAGRSVSNTR